MIKIVLRVLCLSFLLMSTTCKHPYYKGVFIKNETGTDLKLETAVFYKGAIHNISCIKISKDSIVDSSMQFKRFPKYQKYIAIFNADTMILTSKKLNRCFLQTDFLKYRSKKDTIILNDLTFEKCIKK